MAIDVKINVVGEKEALSVFDKLNAEEQKLLDNFNKTNEAFAKQKTTIASLKAELDRLTQARNNAFDEKEIIKLNQQIEQTASKIKELENKGLKPAEQSFNNLGNIAKKVGGVMLAAFAVDKIMEYGKKIIEITATFQKFEAVLTNTLGSRSEAQKALKEINDFAAKTPYSVEELTGSFVKLANAGFKPTQDEMRKLGDLASAMGKSFDQLTEAILDAQSMEFERLKEFGIKADQEGDKIKFTFKGVTTEVAKSGEAVRNYILSLGDLKGVAGGMEAVSRTLGGQISNLQDGIGQLALAIGERLSGAFSGVISLASDFVGWLKDIVAEPVEEKLMREQAEFNALTAALKDNNVTNETRKLIISELNAKYGEYIGNLDLEKASLKEIDDLIGKVNLQYNKKIFLARKDKEREEIANRLIDLYYEEKEVFKAINLAQQQGREEYAKEVFGGRLNTIREQIKKAKQEQIKFEQDLIEESNRLFGKDINAERTQEDELKKQREQNERASKEKERLMREQAEKMRKEAERLAQEKAKQDAELALRELKASQELEEKKIQSQIEAFKRRLQNKNLSGAELLQIEQAIANLEMLLIITQMQNKKHQYEIDKNNRITERKLTKNEILLLEQEEAEKIKEIQERVSEQKTQILEGESAKLKAVFDKRAEEVGKKIEEEAEKFKKAEEEKTKKAQEEAQLRKQILQETFNFGVQLVSFVFEFERQQNEIKLQNLQAQKEAELKIAGDSEQAKAIVQAKYAQEEKKIKEGQARAEKNKALFDIAVNTAVAVAKAIAQSPTTFGLPFSAFALAQGALQAALVASRPIPKFRHGVEYLDGKGTETSDSNLAWLSKGERVVDAETNKKYFPILSAIHHHTLKPEYLNALAMHKTPEILLVKQENKEIKILQRQVEKLTQTLANQPKANIHIDKNGFEVFLEDTLQKQQMLNSRYSL